MNRNYNLTLTAEANYKGQKFEFSFDPYNDCTSLEELVELAKTEIEDNYYSEGNIGYGGVTADNWQNMKTSYAHIGQHSACHVDYAAESREATPEEYRDLLAELIDAGIMILKS